MKDLCALKIVKEREMTSTQVELFQSIAKGIPWNVDEIETWAIMGSKAGKMYKGTCNILDTSEYKKGTVDLKVVELAEKFFLDICGCNKDVATPWCIVFKSDGVLLVGKALREVFQLEFFESIHFTIHKGDVLFKSKIGSDLGTPTFRDLEAFMEFSPDVKANVLSTYLKLNLVFDHVTDAELVFRIKESIKAEGIVHSGVKLSVPFKTDDWEIKDNIIFLG